MARESLLITTGAQTRQCAAAATTGARVRARAPALEGTSLHQSAPASHSGDLTVRARLDALRRGACCGLYGELLVGEGRCRASTVVDGNAFIKVRVTATADLIATKIDTVLLPSSFFFLPFHSIPVQSFHSISEMVKLGGSALSMGVDGLGHMNLIA